MENPDSPDLSPIIRKRNTFRRYSLDSLGFSFCTVSLTVGGFPIKIETKISLLISYSFAIFIV